MASPQTGVRPVCAQGRIPRRDPGIGHFTTPSGAVLHEPQIRAAVWDVRTIPEQMIAAGTDHRRLRMLEFPRTPKLRETVLNKAKWDAEDFRAYRVEIAYPLTNNQFTLAFPNPAPKG